MEFINPFNARNVPCVGQKCDGETPVDKYAFIPLADSITSMIRAGIARDASIREMYDIEGESYDEEVLCKPRYGLDPVDISRLYDTLRRRREAKLSSLSKSSDSSDPSRESEVKEEA